MKMNTDVPLYVWGLLAFNGERLQNWVHWGGESKSVGDVPEKKKPGKVSIERLPVTHNIVSAHESLWRSFVYQISTMRAIYQVLSSF